MSTLDNPSKPNAKAEVKTVSKIKLEAELFSTVCAERQNEPFISAFTHNEQNVSKQKNGQFFGVVQVDDHSDNSSYLPNLLIQITRKEFYRSRNRTLEENFEAALRKANTDLADLAEKNIAQWIGHLNVALGALKNNQFIFTVSGNAKILLARKQRLVDIGKDLAEKTINPIKTFSNVSSGQLEANDKIILLPTSALKIISIENLRRHLKTLSSDEFDNLLESTIAAEGRYESLVIVNLYDKTEKKSFSAEITNKPISNYFGMQTNDDLVVPLPEEELSAKLSMPPIVPSHNNKTLPKKSKNKKQTYNQKEPDLISPAIAQFNKPDTSPIFTSQIQPDINNLSISQSSKKRNSLKNDTDLNKKEQLSPFEAQPEIFISEEDNFEITPPLKKRENFTTKLLSGFFNSVKESLTNIKKKFNKKEQTKKLDKSPTSEEKAENESTIHSTKKTSTSTSINLTPKNTLDFLTALKIAQTKIKSGSAIIASSTVTFSKKALNQGKIISNKTISQIGATTKSFTDWSKKTISQANKAVKNKELWKLEKKKKLLIKEVASKEDLIMEKSPYTEKVVLNNETDLFLESTQTVPLKSAEKEETLTKSLSKEKSKAVLMDGLQKNTPSKSSSEKTKKAVQPLSSTPEIDNFDDFFGELGAEIKTKEKKIEKKFNSFWENKTDKKTTAKTNTVEDFFKNTTDEEPTIVSTDTSSFQKEKKDKESSKKSFLLSKKPILSFLVVIVVATIGSVTIYFWPQPQVKNNDIPPKEENNPNSIPSVAEIPEKNTEEISKASVVGQSKDPIDDLIFVKEELFAITANGESLIKFKDNQEIETYPLIKTDSDTNKLTYLNSLKLIVVIGENNKTFQAFSPITKKSEKQKINLPQNLDLISTGSYINYIYLLDKNTQQIYRYPRTEGGFGEYKQWLKNPLKNQEILDMAVDEKIRLIFADGTVEIFANGKSESKTTFAETTPAKIFTHNDLKHYYLLDKNRGKIIQIDKSNNTITKEIIDPKLKNTNNFTVDENETKLLFSVGNEVLKLTI